MFRAFLLSVVTAASGCYAHRNPWSALPPGSQPSQPTLLRAVTSADIELASSLENLSPELQESIKKLAAEFGMPIPDPNVIRSEYADALNVVLEATAINSGPNLPWSSDSAAQPNGEVPSDADVARRLGANRIVRVKLVVRQKTHHKGRRTWREEREDRNRANGETQYIEILEVSSELWQIDPPLLLATAKGVGEMVLKPYSGVTFGRAADLAVKDSLIGLKLARPSGK